MQGQKNRDLSQSFKTIGGLYPKSNRDKAVNNRVINSNHIRLKKNKKKISIMKNNQMNLVNTNKQKKLILLLFGDYTYFKDCCIHFMFLYFGLFLIKY